jgi:hypothetical protein
MLVRPASPSGHLNIRGAAGFLSTTLREAINGDAHDTSNHNRNRAGIEATRNRFAGFFGLGCDDWRDAYRVNKQTGKSDYNIHSERGTIQKLSPDWKSRETICTGVRFTVSLAFNAAGDLFCTDQEGATWLPNGNPFDELLHIQPGRHYGFPPRHPKYLPDVIDEPSVFDYAPQHQSTCGLHFNEPKGTGKVFGPEWWQDDAIIAGESRGKIWRTQLVKTAAGYVAKNQLIASLPVLTVDACISPQGDLVVATHGGEPDWGSGPNGQGRKARRLAREVGEGESPGAKPGAGRSAGADRIPIQ